MNSLLVGGTGFIGSYITKLLLSRGDSPVLFDLSPNLSLLSSEKDQLKVVKGDALDTNHLIRIIKQEGVDSIIYTSYLLSPQSEEPVNAVKVNCSMTLSVLEAARKTDVGRVVRASSVAAYGPRSPEEKVSEDAPLNPTSLYGTCKAFDDRLTLHYDKNYGLSCISLRLGPQYGRSYGRRGGGIIYNDFMENPVFTKRIIVPGSMDRKENLCYVVDAAEAFVKSTTVKETEHKIFNITGEAYTYRQVVDVLLKLIEDASLEEKAIPAAVHPLPILFDTSRANKELGWSARYTLESGLRETVESLRRSQSPTD
jgi:UDP-glucose 4-epimerase